MAVRIRADVTRPKSIAAAVRKAALLDVSYVTPAADDLVTNYTAKDVRDRMAELAHDETDNPTNDGSLRRLIANSPIEHRMMGLAQITVRASGKTNPRVEMEWGDRMHGKTKPPHDFTRENQEIASDMAQIYWDNYMKGRAQ